MSNTSKIFTLILLFSLLNFTNSFAQERKYKPSEFFYKLSHTYFAHLGLQDELLGQDEVGEYEAINGPYNPITKKEEFFQSRIKYQFKNGQIISLDNFSDSIFLFREYVKSFDQENDSLISSGRLKTSTREYKTFLIDLLDVDGNDSLVMDTIFSLVPDGFWSLNIDNRLIEVGEYVDGQKEGEWHTIIAEYRDWVNPPIVRTTSYKSDSIIQIIEIDKSKDRNFVKENLIGKWYNEGMDRKNFDKCYEGGKCNDFYVKNRSDVRMTSRLRGYYNNFSLLDEETMEYILGSSCGTGLSLEQSKWSFNKNGQLILNEVTWNIEYFTEDRLIISK